MVSEKIVYACVKLNGVIPVKSMDMYCSQRTNLYIFANFLANLAQRAFENGFFRLQSTANDFP